MQQIFLNKINEYFNTSYTLMTFDIHVALRLVSKIDDLGYITNMKDLNTENLDHDDLLSNFKISFTRKKDKLECPFGINTQKTINKSRTFIECLLDSIADWCCHHKIFDEFEVYWSKKNNNPEYIKYEANIQLKNNGDVITVARIYDEDYFYLSYINSYGEIIKKKMNDNLSTEDIKQIAESFILQNLILINYNEDIFNLNKNKQKQTI